MALISDILLIAGALGAALYCVVLSRRLSKFTSLEDGMGAAIATLSTQVSEMTATIDRAQSSAQNSTKSLEESTRRADAAAGRLELLLASLHDLPAPPSPTGPAEPAPAASNSGPTFLRSSRSERHQGTQR